MNLTFKKFGLLQSLESMIQLVSWLKMKVASLLDSAVQKFFG
jgi:hypothetical protein